jgi:pyruvate-ferredoxin/flavodoxin oxidoreductase
LLIAYSHSNAQGIEMRGGLDRQYTAVASGHRSLICYDPVVREANGNPLPLDLPRPRIQPSDDRKEELRVRAPANTDPVEAERMQGPAQRTVRQRWQIHEEMATRRAGEFPSDARKDH